VKVQTASHDIVRQFRYYLVTAEAPEIALRLSLFTFRSHFAAVQ
jgi:hypothetical protein